MSDHGRNSVPEPWAKRILVAFAGLCALSLLAGFLEMSIEHPHPLEEAPAFYRVWVYPAWGFVGISFLILAAKGLRKLVMRSEGYYEEDAGSG